MLRLKGAHLPPSAVATGTQIVEGTPVARRSRPDARLILTPPLLADQPHVPLDTKGDGRRGPPVPTGLARTRRPIVAVIALAVRRLSAHARTSELVRGVNIGPSGLLRRVRVRAVVRAATAHLALKDPSPRAALAAILLRRVVSNTVTQLNRLDTVPVGAPLPPRKHRRPPLRQTRRVLGVAAHGVGNEPDKVHGLMPPHGHSDATHPPQLIEATVVLELRGPRQALVGRPLRVQAAAALEAVGLQIRARAALLVATAGGHKTLEATRTAANPTGLRPLATA